MGRPRSPPSESSALAGEGLPGRVCVAQIGAPHGIGGELRLAAFTQDPMALRDYGPLESEDGSRTLRLEALRPAKNMLIARFQGITNRDAAAALTNVKLYVPRARLPEPEEESYYHRDLIGLEAVDGDGTRIGEICAVQNFGAGDLIEIAPSSGGPTFLLPFTKAFVPSVDIAGGRITIDAAGPETSPQAHKPSPLAGEGGEPTKSASRVRGAGSAKPLTRSSQPDAARTTLSRKGRG